MYVCVIISQREKCESRETIEGFSKFPFFIIVFINRESTFKPQRDRFEFLRKECNAIRTKLQILNGID